MPYPPRHDRPGSLHHVCSRGVARRSLFETKRDIRVFLYPVACLVRRGWIRVRGFTVLTNHYHFLLESVVGKLSEAVRLVEISFAKYFNRTRGRGDALFGRRFWSFLIEGPVYRDGVQRYIDFNAVKAGLAEDPADYPYCSAYYFMRGIEPPWLDRTWLDRRFASDDLLALPRDEGYRRLFAPGVLPGTRRLVAQRLKCGRRGPDPLDDLFGTGSAGLQAFLRQRTWLADQTEPGLPVVDVESVDAVLELARAEQPDWRCNPSGSRTRPAWPIVQVALMRDLAGLTYTEIGRLVGCTHPTAHDRYRRHADCLKGDRRYRENHFQAAQAALRACHGYGA